MNWTQIGPLKAIQSGDPDAPTKIVILHGYGADGADLASLAPYFRFPQPVHWVFLNAPLELDLGFGMVGRAWFPIDQEALNRGRFLAPEGWEKARGLVEDSLQELAAKQPLVLGGFSQGAMVAMDTALHTQLPVQMLLQFSGALLDPENWSALLAKRDKFFVFQSHGTEDPVLPFSYGKELNDLLERHQWPSEFLTFSGGHAIPPNVLGRAQEMLLDRVFSQSSNG